MLLGRLHNARFLLAVIAGFTAFVVQSGDVGSSDTAHRLQATHSIWTSEPPVFPQEYPEFGIHGRNGKLYGWYGMGQSLLMLPSDILGSALAKSSLFREYQEDPGIREIVVSYTLNVLICILSVLVCFRFLRLLQFTVNEALAGALALLFCTTFLHYTQNMMENNYIMLLTLTGLAFQYEWLRTGARRPLAMGSAALGLNLLTRLTTALDLVAVGLFVFLVLWFEQGYGPALRSRIHSYVTTAVPIYVGFLLIDRTYQYYRFGSFWNTYVEIYGHEWKKLYPWLPAKFPWETPFHVGFWGALVAPEKSIFLFDPLLLLTVICVLAFSTRLMPPIKAYLIASTALLFAYISLYARYTVWNGDSAWGDRYVSTAAELLAFISVPILLRYREDAGRLLRVLSVMLVAVSAVIQCASVIFWLSLEIYQMKTLRRPTFVVVLRFKNIVGFTLGKMNQWGLTNKYMLEDGWDYVHITTYNFFPFVLKRVGAVAHWVVDLTFMIWIIAILALLCAFLLLVRNVIDGEFDDEASWFGIRSNHACIAKNDHA